jgi:hypothetical protein
MGMNFSPECIANMGEWVSKQQVMLEQEMIEAKAKEMQTEIDREILWGLFEGLGWTRFKISRLTDNNHAIDITNWLSDNCKGQFERNGAEFLFEDSKDAVLFMLRWG